MTELQATVLSTVEKFNDFLDSLTLPETI
jgi:hypothetical protein